MDFTPRISEANLTQLLDAEEGGTITQFQLKVLNSMRWLHEKWRVAEKGVDEAVFREIHNGSERYHPGRSNAKVATVSRNLREAYMKDAVNRVQMDERCIENDYQEG